MTATDGRTLNQAIDAERSILGAMLAFPEAVPRGLAALKSSAFHYRAHLKTFEAIARLHARGEPVDIITACAELDAHGHLAEAGGREKVCSLLEAASTSANLEHHARLVRHAYAARERVRIGGLLANGTSTDPVAARDLLTQLALIEQEAEGTTNPAEEWARQGLSGTTMLESAFPALPSWIGDGILPAGELASITGHSGVGKTFFTVQLMSALSHGHSMCGIPTQSCRVGLIELEMPWNSIQSRVSTLHAGNFDNMAFLCSPPGAVHVNEPESQANLIAFVKLHQLDVLILDPFNRLHDLDENSGSDMGHVLEGLHEVRRRTGVSILYLHHVRKTPSGLPAGQHSRASSLDAGRGSSRLTNDPATCLALDETKGMVRLTFGKVRHGLTPTPIYLKRNDRGFFDVSDDPALAKARRQDALEQMLTKAGYEGVSASLASEVLNVSEQTIRDDMKKLGARITAFGKNDRRWIIGPEDGGLPL